MGRALKQDIAAESGGPRPGPRHWLDREAGECAWPIGEGTELFSCCAPVCRTAGGRARPYCATHWRAMWLPPRLAIAAGAGR